MNKYDHLPLTLYQGDVPRQTGRGGGVYKLPDGRNKGKFSRETEKNANKVIDTR